LAPTTVGAGQNDAQWLYIPEFRNAPDHHQLEFRVDDLAASSSVPALFSSMANTRSAAKRARQTQVRMLRNRSVITGIKSQQKKLNAALAAGDEKVIALEFANLSSRLDKASRRGIVHQNLANRRKSRASRKLIPAKAPKP
jgi:small subunit ribosomal protein S20